MADYYPLIARAIAGLDPNAPGESRRALYERARTALIAQLRSVQPPLSESEITRERLSLEEAVRKVESESAGPPGAPPGPPRQRPASPAPSREGRPPLGQDEQRPPRNLRADAPPPGAPRPQPPQIPMQDAGLPPPPPRERGPRRGPDNGGPPPMPPQPPGMRGFRDIAADADDLGRAAAQANRAARKTYANVPSPSPEFDRLEPSMENRGADPDAPYSYDESLEEADRYAPQPQPPQPPPRERSRLSQDRDREPPKKRARSGAVFPFKSAIAVGIVLILVGAGILWGKSAVTAVSGLFKSSPVVEATKDPNAPQSRPKIPIGSASRRRVRTWRRWRSASCCMTRTPPIPRASNMSAQ